MILRVRVKQYVYFAIKSKTTAADEIAAYLGLAPDKVLVRGSRRANPPVPVAHIWELRCDAPGLRIDEQVASVIDRLRPVEERLASIDADLLRGSGYCVLQIVRYFDHEEGEEEELSPPDEPLQLLPGQHQLFGWHLDSDVLDFLVRVGAVLDVDEYGQSHRIQGPFPSYDAEVK